MEKTMSIFDDADRINVIAAKVCEILPMED